MPYIGDRLQFKTSFREPTTFNDPRLLREVALEAVAQGASDLYFSTGYPVMCKLHGRMQLLTSRKLTLEECLHIVNWAAGSDQQSGLIAQGKEAKSSYSVDHPTELDDRGGKKKYRFRSNAIAGEFRGSTGVQVVMRLIRSQPPICADLAIEQDIIDASTPESGIVYITGATGEGKSTTFAALLRRILEEDTPIKGNIITIESPIEYLFADIESNHSVVFQTEVGRGVESFAQGIVSFMRHDPSLIVVGETRDEMTASAATAASQTGHLVYTTLHVNRVASTFSRLLSFYPPEVHSSILFSFVDSARMIVNQRLVPSITGGRVALREYLVLTEEIRERLIRDSDPTRITSAIASCVEQYGCTMARSAQRAFDAGLISELTMKLNVRA